jgi:hypothetical protein
MGIQIELATVFTEPVSRRCWLLSKALENASLDEALRLARAADEFLCVDQANAQASSNGQPLQEWPLGGSSSTPNHGPQSAGLPIAASPRDKTGKGADHTYATDHVTDLIDSLKNAGAAENGTDDDASSDEARDEPRADESQVAMTSDLAVLAGMDDIVRYLRQQDDVVVSAGTGAYVVNGRFHLNSQELLARANKIRQRRGIPQFQRIPAGFAGPGGDELTGRREDRT